MNLYASFKISNPDSMGVERDFFINNFFHQTRMAIQTPRSSMVVQAWKLARTTLRSTFIWSEFWESHNFYLDLQNAPIVKFLLIFSVEKYWQDENCRVGVFKTLIKTNHRLFCFQLALFTSFEFCTRSWVSDPKFC